MRPLVLFAAAIAGCSPSPSGTQLDSTDCASSAERVAVLTRTLPAASPAPILDAQFLEWAMGSGGRAPGPTDYAFFARITIDPKDYPAWRAALAPLPKPPGVPAPPVNLPWWTAPDETAGAEFFGPLPLSHGMGFAMITADRRTIFVHTFTN